MRKWPQLLWVLLLFLGFYALWVILVSPTGEFPLNDDWAYAQSARTLLETGQLHISDWSSATLILQLYWGTLFTKLAGGFSFTALRWSTLVFSFLSCIAFYDLLRQLEVPAPDALIGSIVLAVNPMFIYLSYAFMSNIFYMAPMLLSLSLYIRGIRQNSGRFLLAGSVLAAVAYLSRQLGLFIPLGMMAAFVLHKRQLSIKSFILILAVPLLVFAIHTLWLRFIHGLPWGFEAYALQTTLRVMLKPTLPLTLLWRLMMAVLYLGVFTLPVLLGRLSATPVDRGTLIRLAKIFGIWLTALLVLVVGIVSLTGKPMPYLANVISQNSLGPATLSGQKAAIMPEWLFWLVTGLAPFAGAAQATLWTHVISRWKVEKTEVVALISAGLFMLGLTMLNAFMWDEYLIVFVPASVFLVLRLSPLQPRGRIIALSVCAIMLAYNLVEMSEYLAWNTARWRAGEKLVSQGIPVEKIDGGLEWVGWYEFETALPQAIAAGQGNDLNAWTRMTPDDYVLSFEVLDGYQVSDTVVYHSSFVNRPGQLYILQKQIQP